MDTGELVGMTNGTRAVGWRVWTVQESRDGVRLGSVIHDAIWTPGSPARSKPSAGSTTSSRPSTP